jgi:hypothetical protein
MMRLLFSTLFISAVSARLQTDSDAVYRQQQQQQQQEDSWVNRTLNAIDKQFIVQTSKAIGGNVNVNANLQAAILSLDANAVIKHEYTGHAFQGFAVTGVTEAILQALADDNPGSIVSIEPDYKSQLIPFGALIVSIKRHCRWITFISHPTI